MNLKNKKNLDLFVKSNKSINKYTNQLTTSSVFSSSNTPKNKNSDNNNYFALGTKNKIVIDLAKSANIRSSTNNTLKKSANKVSSDILDANLQGLSINENKLDKKKLSCNKDINTIIQNQAKKISIRLFNDKPSYNYSNSTPAIGSKSNIFDKDKLFNTNCANNTNTQYSNNNNNNYKEDLTAKASINIDKANNILKISGSINKNAIKDKNEYNFVNKSSSINLDLHKSKTINGASLGNNAIQFKQTNCFTNINQNTLRNSTSNKKTINGKSNTSNNTPSSINSISNSNTKITKNFNNFKTNSNSMGLSHNNSAKANKLNYLTNSAVNGINITNKVNKCIININENTNTFVSTINNTRKDIGRNKQNNATNNNVNINSNKNSSNLADSSNINSSSSIKNNKIIINTNANINPQQNLNNLMCIYNKQCNNKNKININNNTVNTHIKSDNECKINIDNKPNTSKTALNSNTNLKKLINTNKNIISNSKNFNNTNNINNKNPMQISLSNKFNSNLFDKHTCSLNSNRYNNINDAKIIYKESNNGLKDTNVKKNVNNIINLKITSNKNKGSSNKVNYVNNEISNNKINNNINNEAKSFSKKNNFKFESIKEIFQESIKIIRQLINLPTNENNIKYNINRDNKLIEINENKLLLDKAIQKASCNNKVYYKLNNNLIIEDNSYSYIKRKNSDFLNSNILEEKSINFDLKAYEENNNNYYFYNNIKKQVFINNNILDTKNDNLFSDNKQIYLENPNLLNNNPLINFNHKRIDNDNSNKNNLFKIEEASLFAKSTNNKNSIMSSDNIPSFKETPSKCLARKLSKDLETASKLTIKKFDLNEELKFNIIENSENRINKYNILFKVIKDNIKSITQMLTASKEDIIGIKNSESKHNVIINNKDESLYYNNKICYDKLYLKNNINKKSTKNNLKILKKEITDLGKDLPSFINYDQAYSTNIHLCNINNNMYSDISKSFIVSSINNDDFYKNFLDDNFYLRNSVSSFKTLDIGKNYDDIGLKESNAYNYYYQMNKNDIQEVDDDDISFNDEKNYNFFKETKTNNRYNNYSSSKKTSNKNINSSNNSGCYSDNDKTVCNFNNFIDCSALNKNNYNNLIKLKEAIKEKNNMQILDIINNNNRSKEEIEEYCKDILKDVDKTSLISNVKLNYY